MESSFYTHNSYHFHEPFERQTWSSITKRDSVRQNDASIAREVIVDFSRRSWAFVLDGRRLIPNLFRRIAYIVKLPISEWSRPILELLREMEIVGIRPTS